MIIKKNIKQGRIKIVALALLQLLLFTFPLIVKTTHQHQNHHNSHQSSTGTELSKWEKPCTVCLYEFDKSIKTETTNYCCLITSSPKKISNYLETVKTVAFSYISLRAPPLS